MKRGIILGIVFLIIFLSFVSSDVFVGNSSGKLEKYAYAPGDYLEGWINISIVDVSGGERVTDSKGNNISFLEFMERSGVYFECNIENCNPDYFASNEETEKNLNLETSEDSLIGILLKDSPIGDILEVNFSINSDAPESCGNQFEIDFLNDDYLDIINTKKGLGICPDTKTYGCYPENGSLIEADVPSESSYCQEVEMVRSPGFKVGAEVKMLANSPISMILYDSGLYDEIARCNLTGTTSGFEEKFCEIDYSLTDKEEIGVLCIQGETGNANKIRATQKEDCAKERYPEYISDLDYAYKMFIVSTTSATPSNIKINNLLPTGDSLTSLIPAYLGSIYYDFPKCPTEGCIIPLKVSSKIEQTLSLRNLALIYSVSGIGNIKVDKFVNLEEIPPKIDSEGFVLLDLKKINLSIEGSYGEEEYSLKIGQEEVFSENISIDRVPEIYRMIPKVTYSAYPTEFQVFISSNATISSIDWNFGDGKNYSGIEDTIFYTYNTTGIYPVKVSVTDSLGRPSYKEFSVRVDSSQEIIPFFTNQSLSNIAKIKTFSNSLNDFEKKEILKKLDLEVKEERVKALQKEYTLASEIGEYNSILEELLQMDIPEDIYLSSEISQVPYFSTPEKINLEWIKEVAGGSYSEGSPEEYKEAVIYWEQNNLNLLFEKKEYSIENEEGSSFFLSFFRIVPQKGETLRDTPYLFIKNMQDMTFSDNYLETKKTEFTFIDLERISDNIYFSVAEQEDIETFPMFVSPGLDYLELEKTLSEPEKEPMGIWMILLWIFLVLIVGTGIYLGIRFWYVYKYESQLFKNRNNLYNLAIYFVNSKKKGIPEATIKNNLLKAGWTREQVEYISNKSQGKKIGLPKFFKRSQKKELPKNKFFPNKNSPLQNSSSFQRKPLGKLGFTPGRGTPQRGIFKRK
jgi:hypothetical protein